MKVCESLEIFKINVYLRIFLKKIWRMMFWELVRGLEKKILYGEVGLLGFGIGVVIYFGLVFVSYLAF